MIERLRFQQLEVSADVIDTTTGKIYHCTNGNDGFDLCLLLNELCEEIEYLKKENKELENFRYSFFKALDKLYGKTDDKK